MSSLVACVGCRLYTVNTVTMLATIELTDSNWSRIDDYIYTHDLSACIYSSDPLFNVCVVKCAFVDYCMLVLLS